MDDRSRDLDDLMARFDAAMARLDALAARDLGGLTGADPETGERWDPGQVWAHLAEFQAYWLEQLRHVLAARAAGAPEPIPFGRTRHDPARAEAIERERHTPIRVLHERLRADGRDVQGFMRGLSPDELRVRGAHPRLGPMTMTAALDRFIVGHLAEHADQLDGLASSEG